MNNKTEKIKAVVAKIDLEKIAKYSEKNPKSKTLRQIRYKERVLDSKNDEEILKLSISLAYYLDAICDAEKTDYVKDEKEKRH